ncbi:SCO2400 family protein [Streptomyces formicae]|uniref:SCO2400 family protein n=1 Tax=Streptomyces formicae TaxID=1616117 RepID=UPI000BF7DA43
MDYCHPCRRHLNGALACPGCGTPAEACREYARSVAVREERDEAYEEEAPRARGRGRGRRGHRRRRRKVLLVTAGLALAAGGLSLAELGTEGGADEPVGASAPDGEAAASGGPTSRPPSAPTPSSASAAAPPPSSSSSSPSSSPSSSASARGVKGGQESAVEQTASGKPGDVGPGASAPPGSSPPEAPAPSTHPTSPPDPSESCDRFLWWCT